MLAVGLFKHRLNIHSNFPFPECVIHVSVHVCRACLLAMGLSEKVRSFRIYAAAERRC